MKRPILRILLLLLAAGYVFLGLSRIGFNVDILDLLPRDLPQVKGLSLYLRNFARPDELIVTISAPGAADAGEASDLLDRTLSGHPETVGTVMAEPPWEKDPRGLPAMAAYLFVNSPPSTVRRITEQLSSREAPQTARTTFAEIASTPSLREMLLLGEDPYRIIPKLFPGGLPLENAGGGFSSHDGTFRVLYVTPVAPLRNYRETADWLEKIRALCSSMTLSNGVRIAFTGEPAFVAEISTSMQRDMVLSGIGTLMLIGLLFWWRYRRVAPLVLLLLLLLTVFLLSLATAGFFLHHLTAVGAGFASVMIGLSVDYGFFIHERSLRHSGSLPELRRNCFRNIFWTSGTTAAAFFALNLSSFPGLAQFGNMVGIGVCIGVAVMLAIFAPLTLRFREQDSRDIPARDDARPAPARFRIAEAAILAMVLLLLSVLAVKGFPRADFSPSSLRSDNSPAQRALDELSRRLGGGHGDSLHLVVTGANPREVLDRLVKLQERLKEAESRGDLTGSFLPLPFWPDERNHAGNLAELKRLVPDLPRLRETLLANGFNDSSFSLTRAIFDRINAWKSGEPLLLPDNPAGRWITERMIRPDAHHPLALGFAQPAPGRERELVRFLQAPGVYAVNWESLGRELKETLPREMILLSLGLAAGILSILAFGLRSFRAILLFMLTTAVFLACLAGAMSLLGMTWGFFNMAAIILLLGTGTDYGILLLLSLRRNGGDVPAARAELGTVIFLCAAAAAAGFGSLAWAANPGLASLGKTCALGLVIDALVSFFLLPMGWRLFFGTPRKTGSV
jgi:predicted RND superfamily exporter protein